MARRRNDGLGDLLSEVSTLPWPVGVAAATLAWLLMAVVVPARLVESTAQQALGELSAGVAPWIAAAFLGAAALSAWRARHARRLADDATSLEAIRNLSWQDFERLIAETYRRRGWQVSGNDGAGPDGGVDVTLRRNGRTVLVQAKRWRRRSVGVTIVRELLGAVTAGGADAGIVVASGSFTEPARRFAQGVPIELVDGPALLALLGGVPDARAGRPPVRGTARSMVTPSEPSSVRALAEPAAPVTSGTGLGRAPCCPRCEAPMVVRTAQRGARAGRTFFGCSRFPLCRGSRDGEQDRSASLPAFAEQRHAPRASEPVRSRRGA